MTTSDRPRATTRVVDVELDGARVDRAVATLLHIGVAAAKRLCADRRVFVDDRRAAAGDRVRAQQRVRVVDVDDDGGWFVAAPPLPVLFVDDELIVVDKPAGMPCHPLVPGEGGTVVDAVVAVFPEVAHAGPVAREGGLLHRLDNDTSGCLAIARTSEAFTRLAAVLREGDVPFAEQLSTTQRSPTSKTTKTYLAVVEGVVDAGFVIDDAIDHDPAAPERMRVVDVGGRPARTVVTPRGTANGHTIVELTLHGGRRHQLRVHLAARGHPLAGDTLYGASSVSSSSAAAADARFLLHAWRLGLPQRPEVVAPLPARFVEALSRCGLRLP